jgi:hypothetical protein
MPPCQGGEKYKEVRGEGSVGGGMPARTARRRNASLPPRGANGVNRHAERTPRPATTRVAARSGRHNRVSQAGCNNKPNRRSAQSRASILRRSISLCSLTFGMRPAAGRATTTSVIDAINQRADLPASLPVLILTIPNNPFRHPCALSDYNCGATLTRARACVHVFFHRIRILAGPMDTPLCKISF